MARFAGVIGYGVSEETPPDSGNWKDRIVEKPYFGDIIRNTSEIEEGEKANADITIRNSISIVGDQYATEHYSNIKYVKWDGVYWKVTSVEIRRPRLILTIGGVYNGKKA